MKVDIDGSTYEGSGASKKLAKQVGPTNPVLKLLLPLSNPYLMFQACARAALTCVYNMSFTPHLTPGSGSGSGDDEQQNYVPGI